MYVGDADGRPAPAGTAHIHSRRARPAAFVRVGFQLFFSISTLFRMRQAEDIMRSQLTRRAAGKDLRTPDPGARVGRLGHSARVGRCGCDMRAGGLFVGHTD